MNRVIPKCMPFNLDGTDKDFDQTPQLHADGWMRPCCWLGQQGIDKEEVDKPDFIDDYHADTFKMMTLPLSDPGKQAKCPLKKLEKACQNVRR